MDERSGKPSLVIFLGPEGLAIRHYEGASIVVELRNEMGSGSVWTRQVVAANTITVLKSGLIQLSSS